MKKTSKLKAVDPKSAEPSKPKILIFGKPGVGKTWAALDFPNVYYIDTEGGADLSHYTDKLKKSGGVYFGIEQGSLDFNTVLEQIQALATEDHPYKTVVIDSISKIFGIEITKEAERLEKEGKKNEFSIDKKPAVSLVKRLIRWISRLDMNVILTAHEKPLWLKGEHVGETFDCYDKLEYELHLCLNIINQGGRRIATVKKSRLTEFPNATNFSWSYADFAERYGRDVMEKESKKIILATTEQLTQLKELLGVVNIEVALQEKWFTAAGVSSYEEMDTDKIISIIAHIKTKLPTV